MHDGYLRTPLLAKKMLADEKVSWWPPPPPPQEKVSWWPVILAQLAERRACYLAILGWTPAPAIIVRLTNPGSLGWTPALAKIISLQCLPPRGWQSLAPEVDLRECVTYASTKCKKGRTCSGLKPRGDVTRNPKQGCQWPPKRTIVCQKYKNSTLTYFKKKFADDPPPPPPPQEKVSWLHFSLVLTRTGEAGDTVIANRRLSWQLGKTTIIIRVAFCFQYKMSLS